ncbi:uncharacterized protein BKA78DRAFT_321553 [Phyllosticta capitalensis]|uniref:uncharacterized protein n=1 Tax=Phyllosticta capitalensis TaxID=121624 RepID=UPI00312E4685
MMPLTPFSGSVIIMLTFCACAMQLTPPKTPLQRKSLPDAPVSDASPQSRINPLHCESMTPNAFSQQHCPQPWVASLQSPPARRSASSSRTRPRPTSLSSRSE